MEYGICPVLCSFALQQLSSIFSKLIPKPVIPSGNNSDLYSGWGRSSNLRRDNFLRVFPQFQDSTSNLATTASFHIPAKSWFSSGN
jgi:hypothetical protein